MFWQPRNTLHIYVSPSCLLRGFVFFGAECTDLQGLKNVRNSTLCIQQQKMLFNFLSSRYPADTLQNVRCFCAWLCFLEGLPKESYTVSVAFLPHHWSKRNKTCSAWKPPHQAEIPHASIWIYLHMNHLVSNNTLLVLSVRFAYLHSTWGLRWWKAICRVESTQLFPMIRLYIMQPLPRKVLVCPEMCLPRAMPMARSPPRVVSHWQSIRDCEGGGFGL